MLSRHHLLLPSPETIATDSATNMTNRAEIIPCLAMFLSLSSTSMYPGELCGSFVLEHDDKEEYVQ